MNSVYRFAQATGVPSTGASPGTDFQPQTQNPQAVPGGVQQKGQNLQDTGGYEVLTDNPQTQISVPVNPAQPQSATTQTAEGGGTNWFIILLAAAGLLILLLAAYKAITAKKPLKEQSGEKQQSDASQPEPVMQVTAADSPQQVSTLQKPKRPKSARKRSKSKRKKK